MKVRVLWVPPSERDLKPGHVYDLADGEHLVAAGDAETVGDDVEAEADPRPQPEPEAAPEADPRPQPESEAATEAEAATADAKSAKGK